MKKIYVLGLASLMLFACNENNSNESIETAEENIEEPVKNYPENIAKVFEAHGGVEKWNKMKTLAFTMANDEGKEITTTDLKDRRSLIETEKFKIGFDGEEVWLDQDSTYYKNDPKFYYNLMFYFYAMPFVLADDGITYTDVEPLTFEGKDYPGVKISYGNDVGLSPEDEYVLYYNPDNNQMTWLSYTVTYFSKEKSDKFSYIKYDQWQDVNGLILPKTLQWYGFENDSITTMKNERAFTEVKLMEQEMPDNTYAKPIE